VYVYVHIKPKAVSTGLNEINGYRISLRKDKTGIGIVGYTQFLWQTKTYNVRQQHGPDPTVPAGALPISGCQEENLGISISGSRWQIWSAFGKYWAGKFEAGGISGVKYRFGLPKQGDFK